MWLTRNEKQKMEGLSVCFENKSLIGGFKYINLKKDGIPEIL